MFLLRKELVLAQTKDICPLDGLVRPRETGNGTRLEITKRLPVEPKRRERQDNKQTFKIKDWPEPKLITSRSMFRSWSSLADWVLG